MYDLWKLFSTWIILHFLCTNVVNDTCLILSMLKTLYSMVNSADWQGSLLDMYLLACGALPRVLHTVFHLVRTEFVKMPTNSQMYVLICARSAFFIYLMD